LSATYQLDQLPTRRTDTELVFGVRDDPRAQAQPEIAFCPDEDGNIAVYGVSGSGKSTFLRSLAVASAMAPARGGPVHVYGLDFGSRGLKMLERLPNVGSIINGDDGERVQRLLRTLRDAVDERSERYAKASAANISEYRAIAGKPDEPRILVLVDGIAGFRSAYEATSLGQYWDVFQRLAADGRAAGVHFALSADRPAALSSSLSSTVQQRLVLRLADELDYGMVDAPRDGFTDSSPPGRGFMNGQEVQVGVLGGDANLAVQSDEIDKFAASMAKQGFDAAPPIERLPESVPLSALPATSSGQPTLGIWDETLAPIGFPTSGTFLVTGPPLSGRTATVLTMLHSLRRARPQSKMVLLGQRRSPLVSAIDWVHSATGIDEIEKLSRTLRSEFERSEPDGWILVVEGIGELAYSEADPPVLELLKAARSTDQFVIAESEISTVTNMGGLAQAAKFSRAGIVMQPDQADGDALFKTPFPKTARADYPTGRGLMVVGGRALRVQVADPGVPDG